MQEVELCVMVQLFLAFGLSGLFWPEKLKPVFEVLMFPWSASYRSIRANSVAAIGLSVLFLARLLVALT
jgi:hypothetical protein